MDDNNMRGDDQTSGWLEVKRKHRINTRRDATLLPSGKHPVTYHDGAYDVENLRKEEMVFASGEGSKPRSPQLVMGAHRQRLSEDGSESLVECLNKEVVRNASLEGGMDDTSKVLADPELTSASGSSAEGRNAELVGGPKRCASLSGHVDSQTIKASCKDLKEFPDCLMSSSSVEEPLVETWEVSEVPSASGANTKPTVTHGENASSYNFGTDDSANESCPLVDFEGSSETTTSKDKAADGTLTISEIVIPNSKGNTIDIVQIQELKKQNVCSEDIVDTSEVSLEVNGSLHQGSLETADSTEYEGRESKERFRQRLWCFLFENLNRAVDELYLLCELECDMEQIEEAVLVLEESTSDFKEMKSRVEGFDSSKNFFSHAPNDGMLLNMKAEPRRPHALSWEVRRMATSPHKAEILSSSLEAFRRIQMERAANHGTSISDVLGSRHEIPRHGAIDCDRNSSVNDMKMNMEPSIYSKEKNSKINFATNNEKHNAQSTYINHVSPPLGESHVTTVSAVILVDNSVADSRIQGPANQYSQNETQASKDKVFAESGSEKSSKVDLLKTNSSLVEKEKDKEKNAPVTWKSLDAWKEKRNWEAILKSPSRSSSKVSHSPSLSKKYVDRAQMLHDKLMSPEKKKKTASDTKRECEEKHARARRIRNQLETEKIQRLQKTSEKLNRVNEWQAVRNLKLREGMHARQQRGESRHEAYLAQVAKRAGDESSKVNEVRFITSLNEENKKLMLRQKLHDSEMRRAEKLHVIRTKQKEDMAKEEAALERRKLLEAEKLQRLVEIQRKKEEAKLRREEERKASSAVREARAIEQLRRKEERAKAQQEEAELLAQKLAEKLSESEQRRKYYLEQIREKASMDFRDQSSPLLRRSLNKDGQSRLAPNNDHQACTLALEGSPLCSRNMSQSQPLKRRVKRIRQKLMTLKYEFVEPFVAVENAGSGQRAVMGTAKVKIGRWLQDLQKLRQARKEGSASIGLIIGDITKFLEGKDAELHASRQVGLVDFIASALPASHISRPGVCQVTKYLLRLLQVVLSLPANRDYFLSQNLLPPIVPMLSSFLENYIKLAASLNHPGTTILLSTRVSSENIDSVAEILEGFLWTVITIIDHAHASLDERQLQMRDGLIELVVSYQIIHYLRDLFALYDRPQVEGSPFPSVIPLCLNLLAVLTYRTGTLSSTVREYCPSQSASIPYPLESTSIKSTASLGLCQSCSGEHILQSIVREGSKSVAPSFSYVPVENQPVSACEKGKDCSSITFEGTITGSQNTCMDTIADHLKNESLKEETKPLSPQKSYCNNVPTERTMIHQPASFNGDVRDVGMNQSMVTLFSAVAETGLISLPSLLTAVLLQANNRLSSEQNSYILPSNFEEVAIGVLRVLNNLAQLNITFLQNMLGQTDLKMEFFHLMSFLLSHCTSRWKVAYDQVGLLLIESLSLLESFSFLHIENQAVLRWGKGPTILQKICDLPFGFYSDPELMPILAGTLVASCYGSEQNKDVIQQEVSIDMLLSLLNSCCQCLLPAQAGVLPPQNAVISDVSISSKSYTEGKKSQADIISRSNRKNGKLSSSRGVLYSNSSANKSKVQKETKSHHNWDCKIRLPPGMQTFPLHSRFTSSFLNKVREFFLGGTDSRDEEVLR